MHVFRFWCECFICDGVCELFLTRTCSHLRLAGCLSETQISDAKPKMVYFIGWWLGACDKASSKTSVYI